MTDQIFMAAGIALVVAIVGAIFLSAADQPRWVEPPSGGRPYFKSSGTVGLIGAGLAAICGAAWIAALVTAIVLIAGRAF